MKDIFIVLGNQLFDPQYLKNYKNCKIFMAEDLGLCTYEKHHKLKILHFLSSMRSYNDLLKSKGFETDYYDCKNNLYYDGLMAIYGWCDDRMIRL